MPDFHNHHIIPEGLSDILATMGVNININRCAWNRKRDTHASSHRSPNDARIDQRSIHAPAVPTR